MTRRSLSVLVGALSILTPTLAACSTADQTHEDTVAAAFYPLAWAAEQVAGQHWTVENLTAPGAEPHDLELSIKQVVLVKDAPLVVVEHGIQPAVDRAVEENATGEVLDVADVVALRPAQEHADEGHAEHGATDPHFWLDPLLMADLSDAIADRLAALDEEHGREYHANAARTRTELEALDREYVEGLRDCRRDTVVVTHDAFGYLARYGLHLEPILGLTPDAEPNAATLDRLKKLIRDDGVTAVFSEPLGSASSAESLARSAGITAAELDPIEGVGHAGAEADYLSLMRTNLRALQEANDC